MKWMPISALILGLSPMARGEEVPSFLKKMAGCFAVTYNFVENGPTDEFFAPVNEEAVLSSKDGVYFIARSLLVGKMKQAHWKEEWRLEDEAAQIWQQTVYGPAGDLRYQCSGGLIQDSWRCEAPNSPKPRRDQGEPYEKLDRENTLKFNDLRWIHAQRNVKKMADGSVYTVELGWNRYERLNDKDCLLDPKPSR